MSVVRRGLERVQKQLITDCTVRLSHQAGMLGDHLLPGSSILDVGCGTGHLPKSLEEMYGVRCTGLDVADFNETDIAFAVFDGVRIPLPDRSFDHVVLSFTLHHAHQPMTLIQECRRVARRSVLVFEDMPDNWYGRLFLKVHVELFRLYYRLRPVGDADYRRALEWLGNDAVNVVKVQMPSEWFAKEGGSLYRVPRFLLVYELSELSGGGLSRADVDASSALRVDVVRAGARTDGDQWILSADRQFAGARRARVWRRTRARLAQLAPEVDRYVVRQSWG